MQITVTNFRGVERATIETAPIALIAGKNFAGKSSICLAVAAALSGHAIPYLKMSAGKAVGQFTKSQAGVMVKAGMDKGAVSVSDENGAVSVTWPDLERKGEGGNLSASVYATGLLNLMDMDDKTRNAFLADLLGTKPSKYNLAEALFPYGLSVEQIDKIWKAIETDGWDVTHKEVKEHGAKLKGQWDLTTNDRYGAAKAAGWLPQGWTENLAGESVESLQATVTAEKKELETLIAKAAVDESEIERLRQEANTVLDTTDYASQLALARAAHQKAIEDKNALPSPEGELPTTPCPHCGEPLLLVAGKITAPEKKKLTKAEAEKRKKDFRAAVQKVTEAMTEVEDLGRKIASQSQVAGTVNAAVVRLAELEEKQKKAPSETVVNEARERVRVAEESLRLFTVKTTAERMHASIERNQKIIDALAPDGLRKQTLVKAIEAFNTSLKELCDPAGFRAVSIDEAMDIRYGGRHYALLSASEQYRVKAVLQVAIAQRDGSCMVIFDGADILDMDGREGLFALLRVSMTDTGIRSALVAMTIPSASRVPDLREAKLGNSYWITEGVSQPIMDKESAAA